eukprot:m.184947 g.184947  ORF g.184947 m.184947 type:complete len:84 (-) comp14724_c0_seq4:375-626(-)
MISLSQKKQQMKYMFNQHFLCTTQNRRDTREIEVHTRSHYCTVNLHDHTDTLAQQNAANYLSNVLPGSSGAELGAFGFARGAG